MLISCMIYTLAFTMIIPSGKLSVAGDSHKGYVILSP